MNLKNLIDNYIQVVKNFSNFSGRASRMKYWSFYFVNIIISFILGFIDGATGLEVFSLIYSLILLVPLIAVSVRRMHDVGKDWWYILIPIYNIILAIKKGDVGPNKFGPAPEVSEGGF